MDNDARRIRALEDALRWLELDANIHFMGNAFEPIHMRNLSAFAHDALIGKPVPDFAEAMARAKEKAKEMADFFAQFNEERDNEIPIESYCHKCLRPNPIWSAPSPLWNEVMRGGGMTNEDMYDGVVCPPCFAELAEKAGITGKLWRFYAQEIKVPLTFTAGTRAWNEETWLFEEIEEVSE